MPYYAQLTNGVVTAVTETSESLPASDNLVEIDGLHFDLLGMKREGGGFVPPSPPQATIPQQITRAQGKAALITMGIWEGVEAYVAAIADPTQRALAEVALNDTLTWKRDSPFLNTAASALGLTSEQLDHLFTVAAGIEL